MTPSASPLSWPLGRPRTRERARQRATFGKVESFQIGSVKRELAVGDATYRLQLELDRIAADNIVVSTNLELRTNGMARSGRPEPQDPGVAVYFKLEGRDTVLACDRWTRVADNIVAIAKHIEALRGQDRWGVGTLDQAFAGYQALPPPEQWWQVLGVPETASQQAITAAYRKLAGDAHPDRGGSNAAMSRLNTARDEGLRRARS